MENVKKVAIIGVIIIVIIGIVVYLNYYQTQIGDEPPSGGLIKRNSISFYSLFQASNYTPENDTIFTIDLEHYVGGSVVPHANQVFGVKQDTIISLTSLYNAIKNAQSNSQISVELVRESYIVIRTEIHDLQYVMISNSILSSAFDRDTVFSYVPMQGRFFAQDVFTLNYWQIDGENFSIYIPYHLFDDHLLFYFKDDSILHENYELLHNIGHYYRIYGNMADFMTFYESLNMYEVIEHDNQLRLKGPIYKRELGSSFAHVSIINGTIILSFREEGGQLYVAYSFVLQ